MGRGRQRDGSVGREVAIASMTDAELRTGNTAGDAADGTHVGGVGIGGAVTVIAYRAVVVVGDNVSVVVRTSYEDFVVSIIMSSTNTVLFVVCVIVFIPVFTVVPVYGWADCQKCP